MPDQTSARSPWEDDGASQSFPTPQAAPGAILPPPRAISHNSGGADAAAQEAPALPRREDRLGTRTEAMLSSLDKSIREVERPESGFRRMIYDMTGGRLNPGLSKIERERRDLTTTIGLPLPANRVFHVGLYSQKGGVGKSSATAMLGALTALFRPDNVLAMDVNPDGGSLGIRVARTTPATILDLRDALLRADLTPMQFDSYVNHNPKTRLDTIVLPPGEKPQFPLSADDYRMIADALYAKYSYKIVFIDCGTDLTSSIMDGVIPRLDLLVNVTTTKRDEGAVTLGGIDALSDDGFEDLVARSITLFINKEPRAGDVQIQRKLDDVAREVRGWFQDATRAIIDIPYDFAIGNGEVIDPEEVSPHCVMAYMRACAEIVTALREQAAGQ